MPGESRRSHRAQGPVDRVRLSPTSSAENKLLDSPRRRARALSENKNLSESEANFLIKNQSENQNDEFLKQWLALSGLKNLEDLEILAAKERELAEKYGLVSNAEEKNLAQKIVTEENNDTRKKTLKKHDTEIEIPREEIKTVEIKPKIENETKIEVKTESNIEVNDEKLSKLSTEIAESNEVAVYKTAKETSAFSDSAKNASKDEKETEAKITNSNLPRRSRERLRKEARNQTRVEKQTDQKLADTHLPKASKRGARLIAIGGFTALLALAGILIWYFWMMFVPQANEVVNVKVSGKLGADITVSLEKPLPLGKALSEEIISGTGRTIMEGSDAVLRITVFSGQDGKRLSKRDDPGIYVGTLNSQALGSLVDEAVQGKKEGSRILLRHAVETETDPQMEIGVIDILYSGAQGEMTPIPENMGVKVNFDTGVPVITTGGQDPNDFQVFVAIAGSGAPVRTSQTLLLRYVQAPFHAPNETVDVSQWTKLPVTLRLDDSLQAGIRRGLVDQKVGSRIVMVIPAQLASGDSTQIVVADILAAWDANKSAKTTIGGV